MERSEGDSFFEGDIIFTTIDQLLSSYIGVPVSLPHKLANMPAGALVDSCVVFDEFHLLEPERSLATALDLANRLAPYARLLLMSATYSQKGVEELQNRVRAGKREVFPDEVRVPDRSETRRKFVWAGRELRARDVLNAHRGKSIAVCNTVGRAIDLYRKLKAIGEERRVEDRILLLHSRFLPEDRKSKEEELLKLFEEKSNERAILVATQAIEVCLDISADSRACCPLSDILANGVASSSFQAWTTFRRYPSISRFLWRILRTSSIWVWLCRRWTTWEARLLSMPSVPTRPAMPDSEETGQSYKQPYLTSWYLPAGATHYIGDRVSLRELR